MFARSTRQFRPTQCTQKRLFKALTELNPTKQTPPASNPQQAPTATTTPTTTLTPESKIIEPSSWYSYPPESLPRCGVEAENTLLFAHVFEHWPRWQAARPHINPKSLNTNASKSTKVVAESATATIKDVPPQIPTKNVYADGDEEFVHIPLKCSIRNTYVKLYRVQKTEEERMKDMFNKPMLIVPKWVRRLVLLWSLQAFFFEYEVAPLRLRPSFGFRWILKKLGYGADVRNAIVFQWEPNREHYLRALEMPVKTPEPTFWELIDRHHNTPDYLKAYV
jgi:hypothetical protein